MKNRLDKQYIKLLRDIMENGVEKNTRNGKVLSVFGRQIRHNMSDGFPLLTTKKMPFKTIVTELLWFLKGDTNIKYLIENNCHIWDGDCYKAYSMACVPNKDKPINPETYEIIKLSKEEFIEKTKTDDEFAAKWGELGPIYGKQWRKWEKYGYRNTQNGSLDCGLISEDEYEIESHIDQISNLINDLKTNPDSRRLMVTAWNPGNIEEAVLPPCHYGFQCYTREIDENDRLNLIGKTVLYKGRQRKIKNVPPVGIPYIILDIDGLGIVVSESMLDEPIDKSNYKKRAISLMWHQRSCDFPLGIPFNILSYGLLLTLIAKQVDMIPDELIGNFGDCHIYLNQIDGVKEQIGREPFELPMVEISDKIVNDISEYTLDDIKLKGYKSHDKIYFPLSN